MTTMTRYAASAVAPEIFAWLESALPFSGRRPHHLREARAGQARRPAERVPLWRRVPHRGAAGRCRGHQGERELHQWHPGDPRADREVHVAAPGTDLVQRQQVVGWSRDHAVARHKARGPVSSVGLGVRSPTVSTERPIAPTGPSRARTGRRRRRPTASSFVHIGQSTVRLARRDTERLRAFDEVTQVQRCRHGVADGHRRACSAVVERLQRRRRAVGVSCSAAPLPWLSGLKSACHFDFGSGAAHPIE